MSTIKVTNIQATGETATRAVSGVTAAWATTNQTGTMGLLDSFNISSVADSGTGFSDYTFTNAFASANFSAVMGQSNDNNFTGIKTGHTANTITLLTNQYSGSGEDADYQNLQACGDLA